MKLDIVIEIFILVSFSRGSISKGVNLIQKKNTNYVLIFKDLSFYENGDTKSLFYIFITYSSVK